MTTMTHDDFLKRLAELEPERGHETSSLEDLLGVEAAGHAAACEDCARTAQALRRLAVDEGALFDEPPADYWSSFDARLAERLESLERPAAVNRNGAAWSRALRVAAVLAVAVGLAALALRTPADTEGSQRKAASHGDETLAEAFGTSEASEAHDDAYAAWSDEADWSPESPDAGRAFAALASDEVLPGLLRSPADSLHDELSLELDDTQAAALARLLRAEISS